MVRVQRDYRFEGPDGERSLAELFDGRSQLILYRFFFEDGVDGWPDAGCVGCSSWADGIGELGLLHARDITFAMASPAPQANLRATPSGWAGPTSLVHDPHLRSPRTSDRGVVRPDSSCATATRSTAPTSCSTAPWSADRQRRHPESLTPYGGQTEGEDSRGLAAGALVVLVPPP